MILNPTAPINAHGVRSWHHLGVKNHCSVSWSSAIGCFWISSCTKKIHHHAWSFWGFFLLYSNGGNSADYLPVFKNETYLNTWLTLKTIDFRSILARNRRKKKRKKKPLNLEKIFWVSCQSTFGPTKTMLHPKTDSFLNYNSTLSLPSVFIHLTIHCDSNQHCNTKVLVSVWTPCPSCGSGPYFTAPALKASTLQPVATTGEVPLPLSLRRKCLGHPSIPCHWGMTDMEPIYRNDQDPIKRLQNMPDVSSLFTERAMQFGGICNYCSL